MDVLSRHKTECAKTCAFPANVCSSSIKQSARLPCTFGQIQLALETMLLFFFRAFAESHVPSKPVIVPSPCGMLSRNYFQRPDTPDLLGTFENVLEHPSAPVESITPVFSGMLHGRNTIATLGGSVFSRTGEKNKTVA